MAVGLLAFGMTEVMPCYKAGTDADGGIYSIGALGGRLARRMGIVGRVVVCGT
jgi:hypothetical protein